MRKILLLLLATATIITSGCSDTDNLVPYFSRVLTSTDCGPAPLTVQFNAYATGGDLLDSPTGGNTYLNIDWDFLDGETSTGSVTNHIFNEPGLYNVEVTVTDADGDGETWFVPINVLPDVMTVHATPDTSITASWIITENCTPSTPDSELSSTGTYPLGDLVLNEVMVENIAAFEDPDHTGSFNPWIELYNGSASDISLSGYKLNDGTNNWNFPGSSVISANGFLMIMISNQSNNSILHASTISLEPDPDDNKTEITLLDNNGEIIDSRRFTPTGADSSYCRFPDGSKNATIQFSLDLEMCEVQDEGDYALFDYSWTMPGGNYSGRSPTHTFDGYDVGLNQIIVDVYDFEFYTQTRSDTLTVEILLP